MHTTTVANLRGWNSCLWGVLLISAAANLAAAQDTIPWARDLRSAQEQATAEKRLLLMHFWAPHCPPCQSVERYVFSHPEVARAIRANYVPLSVNAEALPEVAKKYGVDRWPTDVIVSPEGEVLSRAVSPKDSNQYIAQLSRVAAAAKTADPAGSNSLAQLNRQQPAVYQANPYQTRAPESNRFTGESQSRAQNPAMPFAARRPTETTPGFSQYGAPNGVPGATVNPHASASGATRGAGGSVREYSPYTPPRGPLDQVAGGEFSPGGQSANEPQSQLIENSEYRPANAREFAASNHGGGSFDGPAGGGEFAAERNAASRPAPRQHRQVTSEFPVESSRPEQPLALGGYCPVTLVQSQKWKKGTPEFGAVHRGRTYLFMGQREQAAFLADPDRFSPVLSSFDPVKYIEEGVFVEGLRQHGMFYRDQIYLFADESSLQRFRQAPDLFAKTVHEAMLQNAVGNRRR